MTDDNELMKWLDQNADEMARLLIDAAQDAGIQPDEIVKALVNDRVQVGHKVDLEMEHLEASQDEFEAKTAGFVNITEKVQMALREAGEPGIADALYQVMVNPAGPPPTGSGEAVAIAAKRWFQFEGLSEDENIVLNRAIMFAAKAEGISWA